MAVPRIRTLWPKIVALIGVAALLFAGGCAAPTSHRSGVDPALRAAAVKKAEAGASVLIRAGLQENTWTGPETTPKPKKGLKVTIIPEQMASTGSSRPALAISNEAGKLGWTSKISDGQGKPEVQLNALNTAVDEKVDAIVLIFVDTTRIQSALKRALAAGIKVVTLGSLKNTPDTVPDVSFDWIGAGRAIAQYAVWKSGGDLGMLQMKNTDLYITINGQYKGSQDYLTDSTNCPGCDVVTKEWSLATFEDPVIGPAAQAVATRLANPHLNWVSCFDSCLFRVANGLKRAGFGDSMSGAGFDCNPENLDIIRAGGIEKVCFADPREWLAYAAMDNVNRMTNGQPPYDFTKAIPVALFDQNSLKSMPPDKAADLESKGWQGNFDFRKKFEQLWGIG
jgi:ribose transport system substrate-binding protein